MDELDLLDWRRRIFELHGEVRLSPDPQAAWQGWREARDELFRSHPQTPLLPERRAAFRGLDYGADLGSAGDRRTGSSPRSRPASE